MKAIPTDKQTRQWLIAALLITGWALFLHPGCALPVAYGLLPDIWPLLADWVIWLWLVARFLSGAVGVVVCLIAAMQVTKAGSPRRRVFFLVLLFACTLANVTFALNLLALVVIAFFGV